MEMEITIDKEIIEEIDYVINHFVEQFTDKVTNIGTLAICLQFLLDGQMKLKSQLEGAEYDTEL